MARARAEWRKAYYHKRIGELIVAHGGRCVSCGSIDRLEFDHIDKTTKSFTISSRYDAAPEVMEPELAKCQLLCNDCHLEKSLDSGDVPARAQHGTYAMYRHHKCRCAECREANRVTSARYKKRKT